MVGGKLLQTKTIAQLKREIASQKEKIAKQRSVTKVISERQKLSRELFELKNQRLIQAGKKAKRLSGRFGRGILRVGKKVAPVVKKQVRLIRDQQLRDDAIARRLDKKTKPKTPRRKKASKKTRRRKSKRKKR